MKRIIECRADNEYLIGAGVPIGASGSHDDVVLRIRFGEMWAGTTKHITWVDARGQNPTLQVLTVQMLVPGTTDTYDVPVPVEAKAHEGEASMSVRGVIMAGADAEASATLTVRARFTVMPSVYDPSAEEGVQPSPTVAEQLQAEIDGIIEDIASAQTAAASAAGSALAANLSEIAAAASASSSAAQAAAAASSAGSASSSADGASDSAAAAASSAAAAADSADEAQDILDRFTSPTATATTLAAGSPATASYDMTTSRFVFGIPKGATGPQGPEGPQGIRGNDGADGRSFVIQDIYPTLAALRTAFPTGNEHAYQVTAENDEIFIWSDLENDWASLGRLQGPQGPQGIRGEQGPQGATGPQGPQGVAGTSAYTAAQYGGYTGTEAQFNSDLFQVGNKLNTDGDGQNVTASFTQASTLANISTGEKLSVLFGKIAKAIDDFISHIGNTGNPHSVTAAQVGADASGTASSAVSTHNSSDSAHSSLFSAKVDKTSGSSGFTMGRDNNGIYVDY